MTTTAFDGDVDFGLGTLSSWRVQDYATNAALAADVGTADRRIAYVVSPDPGLGNWYFGVGSSWAAVVLAPTDGSVSTVNTISALRSLTVPSSIETVSMRGYYAP